MYVLLAAALVSAAQPADHVWVGPMPFVGHRHLRDDWLATVTNPGAWPTVLARADVFKSYIMVLPVQPVEGQDQPELSDADLARLATFCRDHHLKVAFEVGGLRCSEHICGDTAGETYAQLELVHLRRWLQAGGTIDYLTTDHAVTMNMRGVGFPGPGLDPDRACKMTVEELTGELADYFLVMHQELPQCRFGAIESLGFFQVTGPDGTVYPHTDPKLPVWPFEPFFDGLLAAVAQRGLTLDHFHIDFGWEGVHFDGRVAGRLDLGRVLGVERYVQSKGVKAGVIVNAFHDRSAEVTDPEVAGRQAHERTLEFYRAYVAAGGHAEHRVIQTWQPYPDHTGPEERPWSVLNIARDVLTLAEAP